MKSSGLSICIFCGSRKGSNPEFAETAIEIGRLIALEKWRLVYGAGDVGLMGEVARSASRHGGRIFGVIPKHLVEMEVAKYDLDNLLITETMHERKKLMFTNSDAVVALPGGFGTLDELFEIITWRQLGLHDKPIVLVNTSDYWSGLEEFLDSVVIAGFADVDSLGLFTIVSTPTDAIRVLRSHLC